MQLRPIHTQEVVVWLNTHKLPVGNIATGNQQLYSYPNIAPKETPSRCKNITKPREHITSQHTYIFIYQTATHYWGFFTVTIQT